MLLESRPAPISRVRGARLHAPLPHGAIELDRALFERLRGEARLRLRLGDLLHTLFERSGHHELGFSSMDAYVEERCRENARWGRETRALARRLTERKLSGLRHALESGRVGWSMAQLLSAHATEESEAELLRRARARTVRAMQAELTGRAGTSPAEAPDSERVQPTRWLRAHELQMLALSRMLVDHLAGRAASDELLLTALLGEAETSLQSILERDEREPSTSAPPAERRRRAEQALAEVMASAFASAVAPSSEAQRRGRSSPEDEDAAPPVPHPLMTPALEHLPAAPIPQTLGGLDRAIVVAARSLARHRLELARLARRAVALRLWRRLGFGSPAEYAEQRLGLSLSTLEHLATLARRLDRHPALAAALERGALGSEAALLLGRVLDRRAAPELVTAWIERTRARTYRHLREEVSAVLARRAFEPGASLWPPSAEELEAAAELERQVQSGAVFRTLLGSASPGPQTSVTLQATENGAAAAPPGLRPLRLYLPADLYRHWQALEARFRAHLGPEASFVAFMCTSLWSTWLPFLEAWDDTWAGVYARDRRRCANPVCDRRDVTPHHVVFRAHGGGDEPENLVTLCSWCHLQGVHEGRVRVSGRASRLSWRIGQVAVMEVEGRRARFA